MAWSVVASMKLLLSKVWLTNGVVNKFVSGWDGLDMELTLQPFKCMVCRVLICTSFTWSWAWVAFLCRLPLTLRDH